MQKLMKEYLNEWKKRQKRRRNTTVAVMLLVVLVVGSVTNGLTQNAAALTEDVKCGQEEHQHTEDCYQDVLVCEEEEKASPAEDTDENSVSAPNLEEVSESHQHTEDCYEQQLICGLEEHIHTDDCYIDRSADVEDASMWEAQYAEVEWKDAWGEDLVTAAQMQTGYKESTNNYQIAEDGSHKGYTRYGEFAGDPYMDWNVAFVNFCLYYAGLTESELFPDKTDAAEWYKVFVEADEKNVEFLTTPEGYIPAVGDIVFFGKETEEGEQGSVSGSELDSSVSSNGLVLTESGKEESVNRMGIVSSYDTEKNEITIVEGDSNDEVKETVYAIADSTIKAYLKITELETAYKGNLRVLRYEDDQIEILVEAIEGNAIPEGAVLKVVPILSDVEETQEQYQAVEEQLQRKALQDSQEYKAEYTVAGFLAYDISFINAEGVEIEPAGNVKVTMQYKHAALPKEIEEDAEDMAVTVMHLEEDEEGEVKEVVDLMESEQLNEMTTTEKNEIQSVEFKADKFSTYTVIWTDTVGANDGTMLLAGSDAEEDPDIPFHRKYIKKNSDGTYTISLDVVGEVEKKTVDLMLIIDASSSMRNPIYDEGKRYQQVNNAVNQLITSANKNCPKNVTIRVGIVEFSSGFNEALGASEKEQLNMSPPRGWNIGSPYGGWSTGGYYPFTDIENQQGEAAALKSTVPDKAYKKSDTTSDSRKVKGLTSIKDLVKDKYTYETTKFGAGTNWQAGIKQAESILNARTTGKKNDTYVVFLTDGLPTVRYRGNSNTQTQGAVHNDYYEKNTVQDKETEKNYRGNRNPNYIAAVDEWKNSPNLKNAKAYVVYAGTGSCKTRCDAFAKSIGSVYKENNVSVALNGTTPAALEKTFNKVLNNITTLQYTQVTIVDTLSDNVEYAYKTNKAENFKVLRIDANGKQTTLAKSKYTVRFGTNPKQFKVDILNNAVLENNVTYRVQIDVVPSETATVYQLKNNKTYPNGYPNTGDAGTDGPGKISNPTSSGKKGFYSNKSASVYYKVTGKTRTSAPYDRPVIQVDETTQTATKKWENGVPASSDNVIVTVSLTATKKDGKTPLAYINTALSNRGLKTQNLTAANNWSVTWKQLPQYYYTEYDTNGRALRTSVKYIVQEEKITKNGVDVTAEYISSRTSSGTTTTITNTRKGILDVQKVWQDGANLHSTDKIAVGLYDKNGKPITAGDLYKKSVLILEKGNAWKASFSFGATANVNDYSIKELTVVSQSEGYDFQVGNVYYKGIDNGNVTKVGNTNYVVDYSKMTITSGNGSITVTNTPAPNWQLIKQSSSEGNPVLAGAEFELKSSANTFKGVSGQNGVVGWKDAAGKEISEGKIPDGTYTLAELKAPKGYVLGTSKTVTITKGVPTIDGKAGENKEGVLTFYYYNDVFYELPSTGGSGTYGYTISGILLMMAGILVLYKKKYARRC